jgi:hypothetical protein
MLVILPVQVQADTVLVVDDDGQGTAADCNANRPTYSTVQAAVNAAPAGGTILICPGTYVEQVVVTKNGQTLRGAGRGLTVLRPTAVPQATTSLVVPASVASILLVQGATAVTVAGVTVDGGAADGGAVPPLTNCRDVGFYVGIFFRNASGTIESDGVTNVRSTTRCSVGIRAESGDGGLSNLAVQDSVIEKYGTYGLVCAGLRTACTLTGNTVRGRGRVDDEVQAGISIRFGAAGAIADNIIRDHFYTPTTGGLAAIAVGIFLVNADPDSNPHLLQDNLFINNELDVQRYSSEAAL